MWPNPQETEDLVTFTEEILNGKLQFLCSADIISIRVQSFNHRVTHLLLQIGSGNYEGTMATHTKYIGKVVMEEDTYTDQVAMLVQNNKKEKKRFRKKVRRNQIHNW